MLPGFFGELVLPLIWEIFAEVGLRSLVSPSRTAKPLGGGLGLQACFGAALGGRLLVLPRHMLGSHGLQVVSVALSPVVAGFGIATVGAWRARRGQRVLHRPVCLRLWFALAFGLVRFAFAA